MLLFCLYVADSEILGGSHSTRQYRKEPVQLANPGTRSAHQSLAGSSMKKIEAPSVTSTLAKSNVESGKLLKDQHSNKAVGQRTGQQNTESTLERSARTDMNPTTKETAMVMLKEARRAYLHLCNTQKAIVKKPGDNQRFKAARKESYNLVLRWEETLASLDNPTNSVPKSLPQSQDPAHNISIPHRDAPTAITLKVGEDDSGFTSRAPTGSATWMAERRAFLFKKQYPHATEAIPFRLSPAAVKKLIDKYRGVEVVKQVSKKKTGGKIPKGTWRLGSANKVSGTSPADAIMID